MHEWSRNMTGVDIVDSDADMDMDEEEFAAALSGAMPNLNFWQHKKLYKQLDSDQDGLISSKAVSGVAAPGILLTSHGWRFTFSKMSIGSLVSFLLCFMYSEH